MTRGLLLWSAIRKCSPQLIAARSVGRHGRPLGIAECLRGTKPHPVADIRQDVAAACRLPFADQQIDPPAQIHLRQGLLRAVAVAIDEVAHRRLKVGHFQPQGTDFTSNFINSVVHGLLEQNKNI